MYIMRKEGDKTVKLLGGHFNVKLREYQARWLPCEGESLAAKLIVNHFSHYIRESKNTTIVFTDNQPLAAAFKRLKQGEFSNSSRIASFLTSMCVHDIEIRYYPGKQQKVEVKEIQCHRLLPRQHLEGMDSVVIQVHFRMIQQ